MANQYENPYEENPYAGTQIQTSQTYYPPKQQGSSKARQYFAGLDPGEQERIRGTWGGNDLVEDWYNNAVKAGGITEVDPAQSGGWSANAIRQHFRSKGSDTFDAIDDNTINKWIQKGLWDPVNRVFRPERKGGTVDYNRLTDFKPTDCPEGYTPNGSGPDAECVPNETFAGWPGMPGKGGAGQGGGGGTGGYGGDDDLALYQVKRQYAEALADPTGQKAWQLFAGQGGQKSYQDTMDRLRSQIAGMRAGPERAYAEQQLREMGTNMQIQMPQQARAQAIAGLSGVIQPELGYVGSERDRNLSRFIANTNRELGFGNLALGQQQQNLTAQNQMWNQQTYFPWQAGQANASNWLQQRGIEYPVQSQEKQAQGSAVGGALNQGLELFGNWAQNKWGGNNNNGNWNASDIRVKEDIQPGRRGLSDILKLRSFTYRYKGTPRITQSVMAQDLEKVAPEFVKENEQGVKLVDTYGLLGMTMKAVQELAEKVERN